MYEIDGQKLRFHRRKLGLSLEKLGELLGGRHKGTLSSWETGRNPVDPKYFDSLEEILKVNVTDLLLTSIHPPDSDTANVPAKRRFVKDVLGELNSEQRESVFHTLVDELPESSLQALLDTLIKAKYED